MEKKGNIKKMLSEHNETISYALPIGEDFINMNPLIGKNIKIEWTKNIHCVACGAKTIKSFSQGFCYSCFKTAPQTAPCIINPELCEAHLGIARDMKWSEENCLSDHCVYLSFTSNIKVGVTRISQIPTRWIDQGAVQAIKLARTPNRHTAGIIEVELKNHLADKTSWQKMLKNDFEEISDIREAKEKALAFLPLALRQYKDDDDTIYKFSYPQGDIQKKIQSINLDKELSFEGKLTGIKGQYLIFEEGKVINMRKYTGYELIFSY